MNASLLTPYARAVLPPILAVAIPVFAWLCILLVTE